MEQFLSAVGFKDIVDKEEVDNIIQNILTAPTEKYISNFGENTIKVEYCKWFGSKLGIIIRGELDENEEVKIHSIIPYKKGNNLMEIREVDIMDFEDKDDFYVYFEDRKTGTPITFCLQNAIDYLDIGEEQNAYINHVSLVAMSIEGTIILPINKEEIDIMVEEEEEKWRASLLELAREGDEEAIQLLEIDADQNAEIFQMRFKNEDLLSILEGYFIPYGLEDEQYSLMGTIENFSLEVNSYTSEEVYILDILCLNFRLEVCINKKDLIGVPSKGMRFKGICKVYGQVEFIQ
ncbi:MAG: DUF3881 family protein [Vallitalea sp.]|jgi:hypothetical protein|nr:DUF3881 family protein [Vallitalea sp.]